MVRDIVRHTANQKTLESSKPPASHNDQVGSLFVRELNDCLGSPTSFSAERAGDAGFIRCALDSLMYPVKRFHRVSVRMQSDAGISCGVMTDSQGGMRLNNIEHSERCSKLPG